MATDHHHQHSSHGDDGPGPLNHETTDISLDGIGKLTIGFGIVLLIVSAAMYGTYRLLDRRATSQDTSLERAADYGGEAKKALTTPSLMDRVNTAGDAGRPAAGPMLLTNEPRWLADVKATQHAVLTTYAWVDKSAGTVRLPIERAKQLIVERGLPKAVATTAPAAEAPAAPAAESPTVPAGDHGAPATPAPAPSTPQPKAAAPPH
jgi:hypothetical protein